MSRIKILDKIKEMFDGVVPPVIPVLPPAGPSNPSVDYVLGDGTTLTVAFQDPAATAPTVGDMCTLDGNPAPAGDYVLPDGSGLTLDATGAISAIMPMAAVEPVTVDAGADAPGDLGADARFAEQDVRLTAIETSLQEIKHSLGLFTAAKFAKQEDLATFRSAIELFATTLEGFESTPTVDVPVTLTPREQAKAEFGERKAAGIMAMAEGIKKMKQGKTSKVVQ